MTLRATRQEARLLQMTLTGEPVDVTPKRRNRHEEEDNQADLFTRIRNARGREPRLIRCFATLNGVKLQPHQIARVKVAGLEKGILDVWLISRRGACPGLVIDLKTKKGRLTPEQKEWAEHLRSEGWEVRFCVGWQSAWIEICEYLGIDPQLG